MIHSAERCVGCITKYTYFKIKTAPFKFHFFELVRKYARVRRNKMVLINKSMETRKFVKRK